MVGGGLVCAGGLWLERETVLTCEGMLWVSVLGDLG